jgi:hypothetical protein
MGSFRIHISPEFFDLLNEQYKQERVKQPKLDTFDKFVRAHVVETFEPRLREYFGWIKNGHKVYFTYRVEGKFKVEEDTVEIEEPESFASPEDTGPTKHETQAIVVTFPEKYFRWMTEGAMYENEVNRGLNARDKESPARKIFATQGDWFKENIFVPAFNIDIKQLTASVLEPVPATKSAAKRG